MRELTIAELQAVSGGFVKPAPRPRYLLVRLVVALIVHLLRRREPPRMLEA
jgi:bacteriocin-like protein